MSELKPRRYRAFQEGVSDAFALIAVVFNDRPDNKSLEDRSISRLVAYDPSYLHGGVGDLTRIAHDIRNSLPKAVPEQTRARALYE